MKMKLVEREFCYLSSVFVFFLTLKSIPTRPDLPCEVFNTISAP